MIKKTESISKKNIMPLEVLHEFKKQIFIILTLLLVLIFANHWLHNISIQNTQSKQQKISLVHKNMLQPKELTKH